jgi:hypothetical protein
MLHSQNYLVTPVKHVQSVNSQICHRRFGKSLFCDPQSTVHSVSKINTRKIYFFARRRKPCHTCCNRLWKTRSTLQLAATTLTLGHCHRHWSTHRRTLVFPTVEWKASKTLYPKHNHRKIFPFPPCSCWSPSLPATFAHDACLVGQVFHAKTEWGYYSRCNVNFRWFCWDQNAYVHGVCRHHPTAFCHKLTVELKHKLLAFTTTLIQCCVALHTENRFLPISGKYCKYNK